VYNQAKLGFEQLKKGYKKLVIYINDSCVDSFIKKS
jgi:hypothetical protein